ncbi:MAG: hypothetical protein IKE43_08030 [Coriobacteriales bacterium]|nr:hypothetical protein [Coriobacteriales bacterium]
MTVLTSQEIEEQFGITADQLDMWESDVCNGIFHGEPRGEVIVGRPLLFGQEMKQVGFKEPISIINAIDKRANQLGMRRSDYLRYLVEEDLKIAGIA